MYDNPEDVIENGVPAAVRKDWDMVDEAVVPAFEKALKGKGECGALDKIDEYLKDENPDVRDYSATLATKFFQVIPYRHSDHIMILALLKEVAYDDPEIFPRFRASTTLVEIDRSNMQDVDLGINYGRLLENFNDTVAEEADLSEVANQYISYVSGKIKQ
ncbi:MAG: hypothetical protein ABIF08_01285 [Nanoarchaeota archaeon]